MKIKKMLAGILACTVIGAVWQCSFFSNITSVSAEENTEDFIDEEPAEVFTYGVFTYEISDLFDKTIAITGCDKAAEGVIDIPDKIDGLPVTKVNSGTFKDCLKITEINVPESIESLSISIQSIKSENVSLLEAINVDENNEYYCSEDGILFTKDKTQLKYYPPAHTGDTYVIPDSVNEIMGAFRFNRYLKSVTIPSSVESTGTVSFFGCTSLESVDIAYGVKSISFMSFMNCTSLKEITIPGSVEEINDASFCGCSSLEKLVIEDGVKIINNDAEDLYGGTFEGCTKLKEITVPESVEFIGNNVFVDTEWEKNLPDGMNYINNIAYRFKGEYTGDKEFVLRDGTAAVAGGAFKNVSGIETIVFPESVKELNYFATIYCPDLKSVKILNPDCVLYCIFVDDNTFPDVDYTSLFHGNVFSWRNSDAHTYALENDCNFIALDDDSVKGDVNGDGEISAADLVMLRKWVSNTGKLADTDAADVDENGAIDIFDFCALRKILIG